MRMSVWVSFTSPFVSLYSISNSAEAATSTLYGGSILRQASFDSCQETTSPECGSLGEIEREVIAGPNMRNVTNTPYAFLEFVTCGFGNNPPFTHGDEKCKHSLLQGSSTDEF